MLTCKNKNSGYLFFRCLITNLCINAGVSIRREEERRSPQSALSAEFKEKVVKAATSRSPMTPQQYMLQQQAIWKFMEEHFEWEKEKFNQLNLQADHVEAPEFPSWVLKFDEEEEKEQERDEERERKGKYVEKPKRTEKGKKKKPVIVEEERVLSSEVETSEEEEVVKKVKEMERNEEEEDSETEEESDESEENVENYVINEHPKQPTPIKSPQSTTDTPKSPSQPSTQSTPPTHKSRTPAPAKTPTPSPIQNQEAEPPIATTLETLSPEKEPGPPITKEPTPPPVTMQTEPPQKQKRRNNKLRIPMLLLMLQHPLLQHLLTLLWLQDQHSRGS